MMTFYAGRASDMYCNKITLNPVKNKRIQNYKNKLEILTGKMVHVIDHISLFLKNKKSKSGITSSRYVLQGNNPYLAGLNMT